MPDDDAPTVTFSLEPQANGYPALVDDALKKALASAATGGDGTQAYFDALNATADFWGLVADKTITFSPGVSPAGLPVMMASSGNVELRLAGAYTGPPDGVDPTGHPVVGTFTVTTRNTTTSASKALAVAVRLASMPVYLKLSGDLFTKLLIPTYQNAKTLLGAMADKIAKASRVEAPEVDPLSEAEDVLAEEEGLMEEVGEDGLEFLAVEWSSVAFDIAGMAPLMAIPMIVEFLGHKMQHSLIVQNMTDHDVTLDLELLHGKVACSPAATTVPALSTQPDPLDPTADVTYASDAYYQFINSSDLGAIGHVLTLTADNGDPAARLVTSIPWAGDNAIWVGQSDAPAADLYAECAEPNGQIVQSGVFGTSRVTQTINRLSGTTDGDYFYCSLVLVEPA